MEDLDVEEQIASFPTDKAGPTDATGEFLNLSEGPVIAAIDLSADSEAALVWARNYAARIGAPLEILHVVHDPADAPGTYRQDRNDPLEPMVDVAERKLAERIQQIERDNPGLTGLGEVKSYCVQGLPAAKILEVAQSHCAQLLVLGGHRRNGLDRFLNGSTAHKVASTASLPVTIVKATDR